VGARNLLSIGVRHLAAFLDERSPGVAAIARPAWRKVSRTLGLDDYWSHRRHFHYYQEVLRLARAHVPAGRAVLDVGANDTRVLRQLDWFDRRVALDVNPIPHQRGIERVQTDFLAYRPGLSFDLVICLQVLEHLDDPVNFARKLLATGRTVIVSVPHEWPAGLRAGHVQDPVSEAKLIGWVGRPAIETRLVRNGMDRLIAVFPGSAPD
jgi:hypothetical protein